MGCERACCGATASPRAPARRKASWSLRGLSRERQSPRVCACARARARGDGDEKATRPDAWHRTAWWVVGRDDLDRQDVGCFATSGAADDFELDSFAFVERSKSAALDGAEMNVDVRTLLVLGCDEPVTLLVVEILDRATRHGCSSLAG